jgi:cytochrome c oxidase subunit 2
MVLGLSAHAALAQASGADPTAAANAYVNAPHPWQMWFPQAGSPMQVRVDWLMKYVLWIMTGVVGFVGALMVYVFIKFNAKKNPVASHLTHNTLVEVVWLVVPTILLAIIIVHDGHGHRPPMVLGV